MKGLIERIKARVIDCIVKSARKKSPIINEVMEHPENLKFEGTVEGDTIIVKITKKDES